MTTEQKAKAYDEALEKAKKLYEQGTITESLSYIFPELKESEDERIRGAIIDHLKDCNLTEWAAWLEKQESNLVENGYTNNKDFIRYADNYSHEIWHKLMDNFKTFKDYHIGCNDVSDIVLNAIIDTCNWLEKQGDSNNQNWKPSKEQINALEHFVRSIAESGYASPYDDNTKLLKSLINDLHKLEKQKDTNALIQEASEKAYTEGMRVERKHWLEKQGESTLIEEIKRRKELYSREKEKAVLFAEKLSLGGRIAVLEELLVFVNEKQGEQKPILDFKASNWYVSKVDGKIHDLTYNPTDKTQPKFKVGDWVVWQDKCYEINYNGCGYELIDQNGLSTSLEYGTVDTSARLWDITKDAKDGDVLAGKIDGDDYILIFKQIKDGWVETYGHYYDVVDRFCVPSQLFCRDYKGTFHPVTKEQRDLLFQKMKKAGYMWDSEKKELNLLVTNGGDFESENCEYKSAWNEEDEEMLDGIILRCEKYGCQEQINWLKSIKQRIRWKPNKEQMDALDSTLQYKVVSRNYNKHLVSLYNDLKKLK